MDFNEMLLRVAIDPGKAFGDLVQSTPDIPEPIKNIAMPGRAVYKKGKKLIDDKEQELLGMVDPGPNPEPNVPVPVPQQAMVPNARLGEYAPDPQAGLAMGMSQGRDAQMAAEAAARKEIQERNYYASQGMQYYAPGIGFKGEMLGKGQRGSAFGQSYTSAGPGGGAGSPVAEGGEREAELYTDAANRDLSRQASVAARQQALAQASLSPVDAARINALGRTQYRVDPVEQQAFALGRQLAQKREAALAKAMADTGGDPQRFAEAQARIDALYPVDYDSLLANALGQRALQAGINFTGE